MQFFSIVNWPVRSELAVQPLLCRCCTDGSGWAVALERLASPVSSRPGLADGFGGCWPCLQWEYNNLTAEKGLSMGLIVNFSGSERYRSGRRLA